MKDEEGNGHAPGAAPPESLEGLTEEIDRTREELGETVEALVAKADVTARAREKATEVAGRVSGRASQLKDTANQVKEQAAVRMSSAAASSPEPVRRGAKQVAARMSAAGAATPEPVRRAAKQAADRAQQRQVLLAVAAGGALLAGWLAVRGRRR